MLLIENQDLKTNYRTKVHLSADRRFNQFKGDWCGCRGMRTSLANERADELAKKGADTPFTGPEPVLGYHTAWSSERSGTGWRGNTLSAGSLAKTESTLRPSWKGFSKAGLLNCYK